MSSIQKKPPERIKAADTIQKASPHRCQLDHLTQSGRLAQDHQADSLPWLLIKVTFFFCWEEFYHNRKEYASEKTYFEKTITEGSA